MIGGGPGEETWKPDMLALASNLRDRGYDIEPPPPGESPIQSVIARRDLGDRSVVLAIDGSGRFRAAITWVVGEWPSRDELRGVPVRVIDAVSRVVTVTGQVDAPDRFLEVVASLDVLPPWASVLAPQPSGR